MLGVSPLFGDERVATHLISPGSGLGDRREPKLNLDREQLSSLLFSFANNRWALTKIRAGKQSGRDGLESRKIGKADGTDYL